MGNRVAKRIDWLDRTKGFAIILVVIGHVVSNGVSANLLSSSGSILLHNAIYSFHMPLFFFLSGYLLYTGADDDIKAINRKTVIRLLSLVVPYLIFSLLYWGVKFAMGGSAAVVHSVAITDAIEILYFPIGEYWFLYALMVYTIINYLAMILSKRAWGINYYHVIGAVCLVSLMLYLQLVDLQQFMIGGAEGLQLMPFSFLVQCS